MFARLPFTSPIKASPLLAPLAPIYGAAVSLRNALFDRGLLHTKSAALPVICAGNVTAGGSGKSPFVGYLAARLLAQGGHPVVLSRGYPGKFKGPYLVSPQDSAENVGDEALMHCMLLGPGVPVVIARDRVAGALYVETQKLGDVILLDDGYQHRYLNRDLNLLLLEVSTPAAIDKWQRGKLLPAGYLREPLQSALGRADGVVFVKRITGQAQQPAPRLGSPLPQFQLLLTPRYFIDAFSREQIPFDRLRNRTAAAATAIAEPEGFFSMLRGLGITLDKTDGFTDHHLFTSADWQRINRAPAVPLLTTAKDMVKLRAFVNGPGELYVLMLEPEFASAEERSEFQKLLKLKTGV